MPALLTRVLRSPVTLMTLAGLSFAPLVLLDYTATLDDSESDPFDFSRKAWLLHMTLLLLSFLAAGNKTIETVDTMSQWFNGPSHDHSEHEQEQAHNEHLPLLANGHKDLLSRDRRLSPLWPALLRHGAQTLVLGASGLSTFGLLVQNVNMSKALRLESEIAIMSVATASTLLQIPYYVLIPAMHWFRAIEGSYESFVMDITGAHARPQSFKKKMNQVLVFLGLVATHVIEGFLPSQEIGKLLPALQPINAVIFALNESMVHLGHCRGSKNTWDDFKKSRCLSQVINSGIATVSGLAHAAPIALVLFRYSNNWLILLTAPPCLLIDALLGALHYQQHAGRRTDQWVQRFFSRRGEAPETHLYPAIEDSPEEQPSFPV